MRYIIFTMFFFLLGCTPTVEVDDVKQYKCGAEIIKVTFLEDNSMILGINSENYVLNRSAANSGHRYDNENSKITFIQQGSNTYLTMNGLNYPLCLEIEY